VFDSQSRYPFVSTNLETPLWREFYNGRSLYHC